MADTVILLGAGPGPEAIRGNLVDLAALGLVRRVLWARTTPAAARAGRLTEITAGHPVTRGLGVADALRGAAGRVLLIALDEPDAAGSTLDAAATAAWTDAVDRVGPAAAHRVHLVLPRLPLPAAPPAAMPGWTMLALSPEDSDAPGDAVLEQHRADGPAALARYAAPAVAGLAGLWADAAGVPLLDGPDGPVGGGGPGRLRLVRVHHRRIDVAELEDRLRRRALDVRGGTPQPRLPGGARVVAGGDDEDLVARAAGAFADRARARLVPAPAPPAPAPPARIGAVRALRRFLAFFARCVLGTPRTWYAAQVHVVQSTLARAVQAALYGADSDVEVVCGDHSGIRRREGIAELTGASAALRERLDRDPAAPVGPPPALAALWRGWTGAALGLVDGADRAEAPAARDHYGNPMVLTRPALAVPDVADSFDGAHPTLTALLGDSLGGTRIAPFDPYGARAYGEALDLAVRQTTDRSVARLREDFRTWRAARSGSFAWRTGEAIAGFVEESRDRAAAAGERLHRIRAERAGLGEPDPAAGDRLVRTLRRLTLGWALLQAALIYLIVCGIAPGARLADWGPALALRHGLPAIAATTLAALGAGFAVFARAQRGVLERAAAARRLAAEEEAAVRDLVSAVAHVERAGLAYGQHQAWSAILGRALSAPFGADPAHVRGTRIPEAGMPRATVIAEAVAEEAELGRAVSALRDRLFPPAWADAAVDRLLAAAREAAERSGDRVPEPGQLYGQAGAGSASPLDRLARGAVAADLPRGGAAAAAWAPAIAALADSAAAGPLLARLRSWEDGEERIRGSADLLAGLDGRAPGAAPRFAPAALAAQGVNRGGTEVDPAVGGVFRGPGEAAAGTLGRTLTVVHYGRVADAAWLAEAPAAEPADPAAAESARAVLERPWPPAAPEPPGSAAPGAPPRGGGHRRPGGSGPALPEFGEDLM